MLRIKFEDVVELAKAKGLSLTRAVPKQGRSRYVYTLWREGHSLGMGRSLDRMRRAIEATYTDDDVRKLWREGGGAFIGNAQNAAMAGDQIIPFLRKLGDLT